MPCHSWAVEHQPQTTHLHPGSVVLPPQSVTSCISNPLYTWLPLHLFTRVPSLISSSVAMQCSTQLLSAAMTAQTGTVFSVSVIVFVNKPKVVFESCLVWEPSYILTAPTYKLIDRLSWLYTEMVCPPADDYHPDTNCTQQITQKIVLVKTIALPWSQAVSNFNALKCLKTVSGFTWKSH